MRILYLLVLCVMGLQPDYMKALAVVFTEWKGFSGDKHYSITLKSSVGTLVCVFCRVLWGFLPWLQIGYRYFCCFLYFLHHDVAFGFPHMGQRQQNVAQQLAVRSHFINAGLDQVIKVTGYKMALQDLWLLQCSPPELFKNIGRLVGQVELDKHQQACFDAIGVQASVITQDGSFFLQPAYPFSTERGRQAYPLTQLGKGKASARLQFAQNLPINAI